MMNKVIMCVSILTVVMISFTIGYKLGDSNGYDEGYKEGYRYDCRAEISSLYSQVKTLSKAVDKTDSVLYQKRNMDSVARAERFWEKYRADSAKNWKKAKAFNDSLAKLLHKEKAPILLMLPTGQLNRTGCFFDPDYMKLDVCKGYMNK